MSKQTESTLKVEDVVRIAVILIDQGYDVFAAKCDRKEGVAEIIARQDDEMVLIEVMLRERAERELGCEGGGKAKCTEAERRAEAFAASNPENALAIRCDILVVEVENEEHTSLRHLSGLYRKAA